MLFFSLLICRRLKGFVLSISAKLSHVSELNMRIPGLIMNFNQCFISSFFPKKFESFLIMSPQGSVTDFFSDEI